MDNMWIIALEQMEIGLTGVKNIAADCGSHSFQFNLEILNTWRNKTLQGRRSVRNMQLNSYFMSRLIMSICNTSAEH